MKKPIIIIFSSNEGGKVNLRPHYSNAILFAGGIPLVVPMNLTSDDMADVIRLGDGFLFSGGVDVSPSLYGQEVYNGTVEVDAVRDKLEMTALSQLLNSDKPILGICRGIQSVNVGFGGSLYQDIPSQIKTDIIHSQKEATDVLTHRVTINESSLLHRVTGCDSLMTNSFHHQCVKTPGHGLSVSAMSDDGVIEALEGMGDRFVLLVQWHPEFLFSAHEAHGNLFKAFVKASVR